MKITEITVCIEKEDTRKLDEYADGEFKDEVKRFNGDGSRGCIIYSPEEVTIEDEILSALTKIGEKKYEITRREELKYVHALRVKPLE